MPRIDDKEVPHRALLDAGVFIGALLKGDPRHQEARLLVERARREELLACTTPGILSEVYGALTWQRAQPRHHPTQAAHAVGLLVKPPCSFLLAQFARSAVRRASVTAAVSYRSCKRHPQATNCFPNQLNA